jgi:hypothetical protein
MGWRHLYRSRAVHGCAVPRSMPLALQIPLHFNDLALIWHQYSIAIQGFMPWLMQGCARCFFNRISALRVEAMPLRCSQLTTDVMLLPT